MICITAPLIAQVVSHGTLPSVLLVLASLEVLAGTMNGTHGRHTDARGQAGSSRLGTGVDRGAAHGRGPDRDPHGRRGAQRVLVGYAIGAGIGAAIQYVVAESMANARWGHAEPGALPVSVRALTTFGLHSSATTTIIAARAALVTVVLSRQMGSIEVGLLSVALLPVTLADVLTAPVRTTVFAEQAKLAAEGRLGVLRRAVRTYTIAAVAVGLAASVDRGGSCFRGSCRCSTGRRSKRPRRPRGCSFPPRSRRSRWHGRRPSRLPWDGRRSGPWCR